ncbi:MAG: EAL domain-containing protein [Sideroxydans sp.]|nr:EAL domain-containing protein [Sideroxydans sp.]
MNILATRFPYLLYQKRHFLHEAAIALALIAVALWIRLALAPIDEGLQYITFFPAVTLAAAVAGYRAGLVASVAGMFFATLIFNAPHYHISFEKLHAVQWANLVFLIDGVMLSVIIEGMHRYRVSYDAQLKETLEANDRMSDLNKKLNRYIESLQQAEADLHLAAATFETHEAIMITDADANILRVNHAFERITGYQESEVVGKNPRILSSGRHNRADYIRMWQSILETGTWSGEIWDRGKAGNLYPKFMTISAVKDKQGKTAQYVAIFNDITERKNAEEEIRNLAFNDPLTGLPNRRMLLDHLKQALAQSARSLQFGGLMFLDLDKFKSVNDTLGHEYGDILLIEVANRIRLCVRENDTVARLGGDEFVVLIENLGSDVELATQQVAQVAEKIRAVLATSYHLKGHLHHTSPSIGVCLFKDHQDTVDELLKRADTAMYEAKEAGRNSVRFFDPAMQRSVETRTMLELDIRTAIVEHQFELYYQIQVDQNQQVIGAEALIRWPHPHRGMVSPAEFIPAAEESALILDIGNWVIETACQQLHKWSQSTLTCNLVLAVNISAKQFKQLDFVAQIVSAIRRHNIDPAHLKLELTESIALDDMESVVTKMRTLRDEVGVTLSLDDFGTGYSSLSYLKRLPLNQIKIDQSFVRDVTLDAGDAGMVKAIISMANNFGLQVIAEGVETEAHQRFLQDNGCNTYQGYLYSKPVPLDVFEKLLSAYRT